MRVLAEFMARMEEERMAKQQQGDEVLEAPHNPYRGGRARMGMMALEEVIGPGLRVADIDALVRTHFGMGHHAGVVSREPEIMGLVDAQQNVYDQGYTEGITQRARGLANDVRVRLLDALTQGGGLMHVPDPSGDRQAMSEDAKRLRAALDEVVDFVTAIAGEGVVAEGARP